MKALTRPLVKLTVLSVLAFAPNALAYETCSALCNERAPCDTGCYYFAMGFTTCGDAGFECWWGLTGTHVSMNEEQPSLEDATQTCHEPQQAPESSSAPARS